MRLQRFSAGDQLAVSLFDVGDVITIRTEYSTYRFQMREPAFGRATVRQDGVRPETVPRPTYATIAASVFNQRSDTGYPGRLCVGMHLQFYVHSVPVPEMLVLERRVVTSRVLEIMVNGMTVLPFPASMGIEA